MPRSRHSTLGRPDHSRRTLFPVLRESAGLGIRADRRTTRHGSCDRRGRARADRRIGKEGAMDNVKLGMAGLSVSPIAFGTSELGGEWGTFSERSAIEAIRHARELGINLFDTAQGYGFGASERLLAQALRAELDTNRKNTWTATRAGWRMT